MRKIRMLATVLLVATMLTGCMCVHKWEEATCAEPKTCSRCGAREGKTLRHDWMAADCENPKTCEECDATEGEALGHTVAEWEMISDSSMCGVCLVCREKVEQETDYEILGIQEILGRWDMIAIQPGGVGEEWQDVEGRWAWIEFFADGKLEYKIDDDYNEGTYQLDGYRERYDSYWYFADFEAGYCQLRLHSDGQLYWVSDEIWFCFEKS